MLNAMCLQCVSQDFTGFEFTDEPSSIPKKTLFLHDIIIKHEYQLSHEVTVPGSGVRQWSTRSWCLCVGTGNRLSGNTFWQEQLLPDERLSDTNLSGHLTADWYSLKATLEPGTPDMSVCQWPFRVQVIQCSGLNQVQQIWMGKTQ